MPASRRGAPLPYRLLAGVVPCPAGWLVAGAKLQGVTISPEAPSTMHSFVDVLDCKPAYQVIALSAPIGLLEEHVLGGRACDREARRLLGRHRGSAVVSPPTRAELYSITPDHDPGPGNPAVAQLLDEQIHVSAVARRMAKRYAEVDRALSPYWQRTVYEVHPELSFHQLNEDAALVQPKHSPDGIAERRDLLERRLPGVERILRTRLPGVQEFHLLDAAVALWTARRIAARSMTRIPELPEWDSKGLRMEIVR